MNLKEWWASIRKPKRPKVDPTFKEAFLDPLSKLAGQEIPVEDVVIHYRWKFDYLALKLNGELLEVRYDEQEDGTIKFAPRKDWTVIELD